MSRIHPHKRTRTHRYMVKLFQVCWCASVTSTTTQTHKYTQTTYGDIENRCAVTCLMCVGNVFVSNAPAQTQTCLQCTRTNTRRRMVKGKRTDDVCCLMCVCVSVYQKHPNKHTNAHRRMARGENRGVVRCSMRDPMSVSRIHPYRHAHARRNMVNLRMDVLFIVRCVWVCGCLEYTYPHTHTHAYTWQREKKKVLFVVQCVLVCQHIKYSYTRQKHGEGRW